MPAVARHCQPVPVTPSWESDIVAAHHLLSATPESINGSPNQEWFEVHEQFHRALLAGCGNSRLLDVALALRDSAALYRHWAQPLGQQRARDVAAEHRELLDAVLERDPEVAATRLADHIARTSEVLRSAAPTAEA